MNLILLFSYPLFIPLGQDFILNKTIYVLALIGIIFCMFGKSTKKKDTGTVLLGFATLMFGMDTMSDAVAGLANVPAFTGLFTQFADIPVLGMLAGAVLTCIIQSSSASVGILQALASTGAVSFGAAFPIIMGQNIGTCVTAMISSVGAKKNARRAAVVHLSFNVIDTAVWLAVFHRPETGHFGRFDVGYFALRGI